MIKNTLMGVCTGILLFLGVGCQNKLEEPGSNFKNNIIHPVKDPEIYAFSGGNVIGSTSTKDLPMSYSNGGNGDLGNQTWIDFGANKLENITNSERDDVLEAIKKKITGKQISEDLVFPWTDYFLQDVISAQSNYGGAGNTGNPSASYVFEAFNKGADCSPYYHHSNDYENYDEVSNSAHLNNFFQKQNPDGSQTKIEETTLMTNMKVGTYEEMKGKQFRWYINCHENLHWYEYIVVKVKENYYICFDFACGHKENDIDGNPGRGNTQNDWDYNDWILKIIPAGNQPNVWEGEIPGGNNEEEIKDIPDHVEVNLSIEERLTYLTTHLSIHVRAITDVEVFIPIPAEYICETDDLEIVQKHQEDLMIHGGPREISFNINGKNITLTVGIEAEGIRITTYGVCEEIIEYLQEKNKDGITFEVWNYFNIKHSEWIEEEHSYLDLSKLKEYLNNSTIEFLDAVPSLYVNSFMWETGEAEFHIGHEGIFCDDCIVSPLDSNIYNSQETGYFFNFSPYNELYYNK